MVCVAESELRDTRLSSMYVHLRDHLRPTRCPPHLPGTQMDKVRLTSGIRYH